MLNKNKYVKGRNVLNNKPETVRQLAEYAVSNYSAKDFCKYIVDGEVRVKSYKEFFEDSLAVCRYIRSINKKHIHIAFIGKTNYEYYGGKLL